MGSGSSRRTANENGLLGGAVQPQGSIVVLFNRIANGNSTISFNDFKIQCNMNSNVVVKQLFRAFDQDNDGVISFFDFHSAMQLFLNVNVCFNEQLKFLFTLLDVDGDSFISKKDMTTMVTECLVTRLVTMSPAAITKIVNDTFVVYDSDLDGRLTIENIRCMIMDQPTWVDVFFSAKCSEMWN